MLGRLRRWLRKLNVQGTFRVPTPEVQGHRQLQPGKFSALCPLLQVITQDSLGAAPSAGNTPYFDRFCYNYEEPGYMRRDFPTHACYTPRNIKLE